MPSSAKLCPPAAAPPDSQLWTAARCHRLLRQLQSRLSSLRKLMSEDQSTTLRGCQTKKRLPERDLPRASKRVRFTYKPKRSAFTSASSVLKAEECVTPPRSNTRTLGAMDLGVSSPLGERINLSTPFWRNISKQTDTPCRVGPEPQVDWQPWAPGMTTWNIALDLNSLRSAGSGDRARIYDAICGWLFSLLRVTETEASRDPHPKSLLGLCLQKVPQCIANIEAYDRHVARERGCRVMWDTTSVALDLYGQLEAMGSAGMGWRPMKLALRAHAIHLLSEAAAEGLLEPEYMRLLVRLCLELNYAAEAGKLAVSLDMTPTASRGLLLGATGRKEFLPLREMLHSFAGKQTPPVSLYWISSLCQRDLLPTDCLVSSALLGLLESSVHLITTNRWGQSVSAFLASVLPLFATLRPEVTAAQQESMEQILASVVAAVVAAVTAGSGMHGSEETLKRRTAWRRVLLLLDGCLAEARHSGRRRRRRLRPDGQDNGVFIFALARHLTLTKSPFDDASLQQQAATELEDEARVMTSTATAQARYRQATILISWLAQYRSKSCAMSVRDSVAEQCSKLAGLNLGVCFGAGLATDVAFVLAQKTKNLRDLAFAESLRSAAGSSKESIMFSGWQWEEGISEWVQPREKAENPEADTGARQPDQQSRSSRRVRLVRTRWRDRLQTKSGPWSGSALGHEPEPLLAEAKPAIWRTRRVRPRPSAGPRRGAYGSDDDRDDLC